MNLTTKATMSSLEIATLTGKEHFNVMRDIKVMLDELEIDAFSFEGIYLDTMNRERSCINLPKRECLILVSGYNIKMRAAIIDRWSELETILKISPSGTSPSEAVRVAHAISDALRMCDSGRLGTVRKALELTAPDMLTMLPKYAIDAPSNDTQGSSLVSHSLTFLLKSNDFRESATFWNKKLLSNGFIQKEALANGKPFWSVTDKGLKYGKNMVCDASQKTTQPYWYDKTFLQLIDECV